MRTATNPEISGPTGCLATLTPFEGETLSAAWARDDDPKAAASSQMYVVRLDDTPIVKVHASGQVECRLSRAGAAAPRERADAFKWTGVAVPWVYT